MIDLELIKYEDNPHHTLGTSDQLTPLFPLQVISLQTVACSDETVGTITRLTLFTVGKQTTASRDKLQTCTHGTHMTCLRWAVRYGSWACHAWRNYCKIFILANIMADNVRKSTERWHALWCTVGKYKKPFFPLIKHNQSAIDINVLPDFVSNPHMDVTLHTVKIW